MPLRDHFRPPVDEVASWEELHGGWPMVIVQRLRQHLPAGYVAGPRVQLGSRMEIDIASFENEEHLPLARGENQGGVAVAAWAPSPPSLTVEAAWPDCDEYEVRVYDARRRRRLVAAIEIVSPSNKDRPEPRDLFVAKCAALFQQGIAVSIVDLVSVRKFNLYADLMALFGHADPTFGRDSPPLYAASCRRFSDGDRTILEAWSHELIVGQPLPTLPLWLSRDLVVPLDLEASYEQACHDLWIT